MSETIVFKDREEAGRMLAERIAELKAPSPAVFAMPRGGVPVGFQVAKEIGAPLDTVIVRRLGAPGNPEFGFGAIAPGDVIILNDNAVDSVGLSRREIDEVLARERQELDRRMVHYRTGDFTRETAFETAIIIDDGLATGVSARAAIDSVKLVQRPKRIIYAAPVGSKDALKAVISLVDDAIAISTPDYFLAVGQSYERFNQVSDDEVIYLLHSANDARKAQ